MIGEKNIRRDINHQASTHWWIVGKKFADWPKTLLLAGFFFYLPLRCFSLLEPSPEDPKMKICDQHCFAAAPGYDCMSKINWDWFLACPSKSPAAHYDTAEGRKHLPMFSWPKEHTDIYPRVYPTADCCCRMAKSQWVVCVAVLREKGTTGTS